MDEIYMRWMRYIFDGYDIYAMDEIYMRWMRYICDICLYECICHDGMQKKITVLGHLCCTRQSTPLPSAMVTTLGKAGKMGDQKTDFPALPSAVTITLGKEI